MASGFVIPAGDLDSLLAPIGALSPIAATGFLIAGQDAANRYAPAAYGAAYGTTNFVCPAGDLGALFAALGSTGYSGTLTAAAQSATEWGFMSGSLGAITPATFRSLAIHSLLSGTTGAVNTNFQLMASGSLIPPANFFTTLTVNGTALASASAAYNYTGPYATWTWTTQTLHGAGTYPVLIS